MRTTPQRPPRTPWIPPRPAAPTLRATLRRTSAEWRGVVKAGWITTCFAAGLAIFIAFGAVYFRGSAVLLLWLISPAKLAAVAGAICGIVAMVRGAPWHGLGIIALAAITWTPDFLTT